MSNLSNFYHQALLAAVAWCNNLEVFEKISLKLLVPLKLLVGAKILGADFLREADPDTLAEGEG